MRVLVALEDRFFKTKNGNIYSQSVCDYSFWARYLQVFDEVIVFARVSEIPEIELSRTHANGPGVSFIELPTYIGPWQYIRHYPRLRIVAKESLLKADAYILRVPGPISSLIWRYLEEKHFPYGVEVLGDSWDTLGKGGVKSVLRPIARYILARNQKKQCQNAMVASYVSKQYLQQRYPTPGWTTYYSSIELTNESIIDSRKLAERLTGIRSPPDSSKAFKICHTGTMSALYKAQDTLIEAVSICRKRGFNVELILLGDGKYQKVFTRKAQQLGILKFVNFVGRVPPGRAVIKYLDSADMFVLPSITEGLPRSLIEAMARGLPCLGSRVDGILELLPTEDTFPPRKANELAERIIATLSNPDKLAQMANRNLEKAKEYRSEELNKRRIEFYKKVAEKTTIATPKKIFAK